MPLSLDCFCIYLSVPLNLDVRLSKLSWAFYFLVFTCFIITGFSIICGFHPSGWNQEENCPDWQTEDP
ncbi:hypothetical protein EZJ55_10545 [Microcystis aeruginosa EAWAG127a]|uniref:Uncharacterized protein n=1 Tax=Microcystis aeruginosa EAWAG127a TaxID=2529855 RepID=A0A5J5LT83_MICAE|nr:hypothetical protein EZJ55_10545 [Microcystis aeruginosa EAWAG127a]